jgi:hypothetical protein
MVQHEEIKILEAQLKQRDEYVQTLTQEVTDLRSYKDNGDSKICEEIKQMSSILEEFDDKYSEMETKYDKQVKEVEIQNETIKQMTMEKESLLEEKKMFKVHTNI